MYSTASTTVADWTLRKSIFDSQMGSAIEDDLRDHGWKLRCIVSRRNVV